MHDHALARLSWTAKMAPVIAALNDLAAARI
jgi:hypothetical protein